MSATGQVTGTNENRTGLPASIDGTNIVPCTADGAPTMAKVTSGTRAGSAPSAASRERKMRLANSATPAWS